MLSTPHIRAAPDHGAVLVVGLFWGNCPVPRSEPSPQTAFPQLLGVRKSTGREKTKALSALVEEQSQPARNQPSALPSDRAAEFIVLLSW